MSEDLSNSTVYYVCHTYDSFVKNQAEIIAKYVKNAIAFVRVNKQLDLAAQICPRRFENCKIERKVNLTNTPSNCNVHATPVPYIPLNFDYLRMGDRHYNAVLKSIKDYNIPSPSLIHTHFLWSSGYVGARLKKDYEIPLVVTGHGYDVYHLPFKSEAWKRRICDVLNTADHVITVSNTNLACIEKLGIETPVTVLPNGFNENIFYPRDRDECRRILGLPLDKKIILTVGHCVGIKGHKYLIEAMKKIHTEHPDALCVIVGGGKLYPNEVRMVEELGLSECVKMIGPKMHEEIPFWMNACDMFVLPSLNESFGVVNIEALACGKPVVASNVGGIPDIICSDKYGMLCEAGNADKLACAISDALEREWDETAILEYAERYQLGKVCREIVEIYKSVIGAGNL